MLIYTTNSHSYHLDKLLNVEILENLPDNFLVDNFLISF